MLILENQWLLAISYLLLSLIGGFFFAWLGYRIAALRNDRVEASET
jgi:fluoride ion exporter CrcB/FEX